MEQPAEALQIEVALSLEIDVEEDVGLGVVEVAGANLIAGQMPEQRGLADTPLADDGYRLRRLVAKTRHGAIQHPATSEETVRRANHRSIQVGVPRPHPALNLQDAR